VLPVTPLSLERTTRIERAPPGWRPGALPSELHPRESLRQESNPHLGRTKGACYAVDTTEAKWRRRESNPHLLVASEALCHQSYIPREVRTGRVERPQREAAGLQPVELTSTQRPQDRAAGRIRTGTSRITTSDAAVTPQPPRTEAGTTGFEPAASRLTSERSARLSYAPK
jgi:hypothetical protein